MVRYCPNPSCPHRRQDVWLGLWWRASRRRSAAEFLDHVAVCNECGTQLVGEDGVRAAEPEKNALATEDHAETGDDSSEARINVGTGLVLIGLSILLAMSTCAGSASAGGGHIMLPLGPSVYGLYRLSKGLNAMKLARAAEALKASAGTESNEASGRDDEQRAVDVERASVPAPPTPPGRESSDALAWVCLCGTRNARKQTRCRACNAGNPY